MSIARRAFRFALAFTLSSLVLAATPEAQLQRAKTCAPAPKALPTRASEVPDPLAVGRVFVGTWFDETWCRAEVVQRDRGARTAAVRIIGERQARFRAELKTSKDGSSFTITDIRQVAPAPGERMKAIDFKSGSGSVSAKQLRMSWRAKISGPGFVDSWNATVKTKPV